MELLICKCCGANELVEKNGILVCTYCGSKFQMNSEVKANNKNSVEQNTSRNISKSSGISLNNDVQRLLEKCKNESRNAKKYANLILDIDPDNKEALKYLK